MRIVRSGTRLKTPGRLALILKGHLLAGVKEFEPGEPALSVPRRGYAEDAVSCDEPDLGSSPTPEAARAHFDVAHFARVAHELGPPRPRHFGC